MTGRPRQQAGTKWHGYYTEIYGMALEVPLRGSEVLAAFGASLILGLALFHPFRELAEYLFPEPTPLRILPLLAGLAMTAAPLLWVATKYRPADTAARQNSVTTFEN
ncbi:hypothetical protein Achl_4464 (plasmid) [Pseudarthrobacter chlorophenolicus A6]|uniref:Uncharacterized protein n=1 Tax=Pseudarthrobacter chlorophenolicus (strain ATCC 700700 / DSM 12829 / CIP 107037 / JCM 12360 / KCTC 9906 / NCIMB 13794 / A6) TaxID=452863 RepID=B8HJ18_PSECP|nr:hypothetical protein [Pseudarthrobacter chlorophenolicus]ACL42415.1 hypothetical protein Achl_4464 [Pseudarthrobacter chlorophenolicus A6]SDQ17816.1 hypothetical protein SAMN04489738_0521 [Pseudarthrobacter chlorophenolicus]